MLYTVKQNWKDYVRECILTMLCFMVRHCELRYKYMYNLHLLLLIFIEWNDTKYNVEIITTQLMITSQQNSDGYKLCNRNQIKSLLVITFPHCLVLMFMTKLRLRARSHWAISLVYATVIVCATKWLLLISMELFTLSGSKYQRKQSQTQTQVLSAKRPFWTLSVQCCLHTEPLRLQQLYTEGLFTVSYYGIGSKWVSLSSVKILILNSGIHQRKQSQT